MEFRGKIGSQERHEGIGRQNGKGGRKREGKGQEIEGRDDLKGEY